MYTELEIYEIASAMVSHGGQFIKNIGKALLVADSENKDKILKTWSSEIDKYYEMSLYLKYNN
jgi:hypothetical protein